MGKYLSRLLIVVALGACVVAVSGSAAAFTYKIPSCVVPNVKGKQLAQAQNAIRKASCAVGPTSTAKSTTVKAGYVISTSPAAGATLPAGAAVSITVSIGNPVSNGKSCVVPKVANDTVPSAATAINKANCQVGTITSVTSKKVPTGKVISSTPDAGTTLAPLGTVNLTVSSGAGLSPTAPCHVPPLKDLNSKQAVAALLAGNCSVGTVTLQSSTKVPKGKVISNSPATGSTHPTGTPVDFVLSSGKPKKK
jgi:serine/threonine-protein kinase